MKNAFIDHVSVSLSPWCVLYLRYHLLQFIKSIIKTEKEGHRVEKIPKIPNLS